MTIKGILLAGAALCTLSIAPALANSAPKVAIAAAHPGHFTVKTPLHSGRVSHLTSSGFISTGVSTSADYKVKTALPATYYTYFDSGSFCDINNGPTKVKLSTKKTTYAKLGTGTETLTGYCSTQATVFYGDTYELKTKGAVGQTDSFISSLEGKKIHFNGGVYDITVNFTVDVYIGS